MAGHGMNSYAWTYRVVVEGVCVIAQIGRGGVYRDAARVAEEWESTMARIARFLDLVERPASGTQLVVAFSPMRGAASWATIDETMRVRARSIDRAPGFQTHLPTWVEWVRPSATEHVLEAALRHAEP